MVSRVCVVYPRAADMRALPKNLGVRGSRNMSGAVRARTVRLSTTQRSLNSNRRQTRGFGSTGRLLVTLFLAFGAFRTQQKRSPYNSIFRPPRNPKPQLYLLIRDFIANAHCRELKGKRERYTSTRSVVF